MIEDQVLFHLSKFGENIFSLKGIFHAHWSGVTKLYLREPDLGRSNRSRLIAIRLNLLLDSMENFKTIIKPRFRVLKAALNATITLL